MRLHCPPTDVSPGRFAPKPIPPRERAVGEVSTMPPSPKVPTTRACNANPANPEFPDDSYTPNSRQDACKILFTFALVEIVLVGVIALVTVLDPME
jgi:hypothetical protein